MGWTNAYASQSFAASVSFSTAMQITGMDIYTESSFVTVGDTARIRLFSDTLGHPGTVLSNFTESVSVVDTNGAMNVFDRRVHVDFTNPLSLLGNTTYWIGMTGDSKDFTQTGLTGSNAPDGAVMAQFNGGDTFRYFTATFVGAMAFRLEGNVAAPEPTGLALLVPVAFAGVVQLVRRRRQAA
jgi:hypothetical protein